MVLKVPDPQLTADWKKDGGELSRIERKKES
jgi:hypothetical protein